MREIFQMLKQTVEFHQHVRALIIPARKQLKSVYCDSRRRSVKIAFSIRDEAPQICHEMSRKISDECRSISLLLFTKLDLLKLWPRRTLFEIVRLCVFEYVCVCISVCLYVYVCMCKFVCVCANMCVCCVYFCV